jgi:hypothetical protein
MKKVMNILLLSACLGLALVIAATARVMFDEISEKGLKRVGQEIWYGRGNVVE